MTNDTSAFRNLSDLDLLSTVKTLATDERHATARLIAALAELDARRLYLGEGCASLFAYCTQVLRLSEHAAYGRIEAARAARRFPSVLSLLADGSVTLTTIGLLRSGEARGGTVRRLSRGLCTTQPPHSRRRKAARVGARRRAGAFVGRQGRHRAGLSRVPSRRAIRGRRGANAP
jgi:hypothetical protein